MSAQGLMTISVGLAAFALLLLGAVLLSRVRVNERSGRMLGRVLDRRASQSASAQVVRQAAPVGAGGNAPGVKSAAGTNAANATHAANAANGARGWRHVVDRLANVGMRWFDTPLGRQLVAKEDQLLIEQCGFVDPRARGIFLASRVLCGIGAPIAASVAFSGSNGPGAIRFSLFMFIALCIGFMVPKWILGRIAANRKQCAVDELPMLIDLLRLLQGVGLSIDQSVQVMVTEFKHVLPVLGQELEIANRQFVTGRTREQSLQRLANTYDNDDLRAITRLIVQVDRHGGAVQEPLKQFAERLREGRRTAMRERIGKLTVKMTTVMITTLLPALLIVTAGPGFIAVIRSMSSLAHK